MKTIVFDTNELCKDWMLRGLKYQLFNHLFHRTWFTVYVPATVFEEVIGAHQREVERIEALSEKLGRERIHLGLGHVEVSGPIFDYRAYISERFDDQLGFNILPWPTITHDVLVRRAIDRIPPFNDNGGGYRDALIWSDVVGLAKGGHDIAFVTMDKAFVGPNGALKSVLQEEVDAFGGSVELVRDLSRWLLAALPWDTVPDLPTAVSYSQHSEFYEYYLTSDFQDELRPTVEDLGFAQALSRLEITDVRWDGNLTPVQESSQADHGLKLVEYDLGQTVEYRVRFVNSEGAPPEWASLSADALDDETTEGSVRMVLRVAVLFGGEFGFTIEQMSWRRSDGTTRGLSLDIPDGNPDQPLLLD